MFLLISLSFVLFSCEKDKVKDENTPYFEGIIKLSESQGIYGSLFKAHTTYWISENKLKREQKLGGINSIANSYAGIIIDLEKDSVILYFSEIFTGKFKCKTTLKEYKSLLDSLPRIYPSPVDRTFTTLPNYKLIEQKKGSTEIKGFNCDYTLYKSETGILKQEVFDTKEIKVKPEILEIVFENLPSEINFPLKSELSTTVSEFKNDSIVSGKQAKEMDEFIRNIFNNSDPEQASQKTDLDKLAKNKWIDKGLNLIKKGIDLSIQITMEVTDLKAQNLSAIDFSLPSGHFKEITDLSEFMSSLPQENHNDFDD